MENQPKKPKINPYIALLLGVGVIALIINDDKKQIFVRNESYPYWKKASKTLIYLISAGIIVYLVLWLIPDLEKASYIMGLYISALGIVVFIVKQFKQY